MSQVFQVLKRRKNRRLEETAEESFIFCDKNVIPQQEAYEKIFPGKKLEKIKELHSNFYDFAKEKESSTPFTMGGEGAVDLIYSIVKNSGAKKIIETGVAYGWSSLAILLAIKDRDDSKLISNDMPYIKMDNDDYVGCIVDSSLKNKWDLQRLPDIKGIPLALKKFENSIDLFHYDSDKSYTGRMWATPIIWAALKDGGIFISDDIDDNIAFKDFCDSIKKKPIIVEHKGKFVGIIQK